MGGAISLAALTLIGVGVVVVILYGTRGESNRWPGVGVFRGRQGGFGMGWWRDRGRGGAGLPDADQALGPHYDLLTVDRRLRELNRRGARRSRGASWMDAPGAMEQAGLVEDTAHHELTPKAPPSGD